MTAVRMEGGDDRQGPEARSVLARSGVPIDTSTGTWRLSADRTLRWARMTSLPPHLLSATRDYARHLIRTGSPEYVASQFGFLKTTLDSVEDLLAPLREEDDVDNAIFSAAHSRLGGRIATPTIRDALGAYRRWYVWCCDAGFAGFDEDVATRLEERRIGHSAKGAAVLSHDPDRGPLNDVEFNAFTSKLRSAAGEALPLADRVASWLCLCFGTNAKNLQLLHEEDLVKTALDDGTAVYELRMPRIKKRMAGERDAFKTRPLDARLGALIEQLIAANAEARAKDPDWDDAHHHRPLLARRRGLADLAGTPFSRDAYRSGQGWVYGALQRAAGALGLRAFPSGTPLNLTPRRLRYSFATRMVKAGASPVDLAEALDHTDTSHVMVYFNARSDIVARLDERLAIKLAPCAQAFMGALVRSEAEATRGRDPTSRVRRFDRRARKLEAVGSCGNFGFCGLYAPIACYTCALFQPWLEGPHAAVLAEMLEAREGNLERGASPSIVQLHDLTIYAVAEVVRRCEEMKAEAGGGSAP